MVSMTMVAADAEKGVVVKANAPKASAKAAAPRTTTESSKKAASAAKAKVPAKASPVAVQKASKPGRSKACDSGVGKGRTRGAQGSGQSRTRGAQGGGQGSARGGQGGKAPAAAKAVRRRRAKAVPAATKAVGKGVREGGRQVRRQAPGHGQSRKVACKGRQASGPSGQASGGPGRKAGGQAPDARRSAGGKEGSEHKAGPRVAKASELSKARAAKAATPARKAQGPRTHRWRASRKGRDHEAACRRVCQGRAFPGEPACRALAGACDLPRAGGELEGRGGGARRGDGAGRHPVRRRIGRGWDRHRRQGA